MIDYIDLGYRIREIRRSASITLDELAEQVGLTPAFLGHIERGSRAASLDTFVAICNVLRVSPVHLLASSLHEDFNEHQPEILSPEDRENFNELLRAAIDELGCWHE